MQKRAKIEAASPPTPLLLTFSVMNHTLCVLLLFFFRIADLSTCSRGSSATSSMVTCSGWPMSELQTIDDERLKISILKYTELRLAISYEPSSDSIVSNLEKLSNKNLSREFSQKMVLSGLKERQELFVDRICSMLTK